MFTVLSSWHPSSEATSPKAMLHTRRKRSKSPFAFKRSHSPSPSSRSGSGRSTPSVNGISAAHEEGTASPLKGSPSHTPSDRRSVASFESSSSAGVTPSSTMESITTPSLPKVVTMKRCQLRKRPLGSDVSGWGFVLRGTTSEFKTGTRVYTCHVELVKEKGAAMVRNGYYAVFSFNRGKCFLT